MWSVEKIQKSIAINTLEFKIYIIVLTFPGSLCLKVKKFFGEISISFFNIAAIEGESPII